jgi:2-methylcitrate dehydratase PrpD
VTTFGGAIGGGKLLRLSRDKMAHAIDIVGYNAPVPSLIKWARTRKGGMETHDSAGWICLTATIAALLADMSYTGDQTVLEGEYGFWRYYGSPTWDKHKVTEKPGMSWRMVDGTGSYKA